MFCLLKLNFKNINIFLVSQLNNVMLLYLPNFDTAIYIYYYNIIKIPFKTGFNFFCFYVYKRLFNFIRSSVLVFLSKNSTKKKINKNCYKIIKKNSND